MKTEFLNATRAPQRRRSPRLTPDPLLVLGLPGGNCGIVLDISEHGLGFLAAAPLATDLSALRFSVAARSVELCEAAGRLAWKDAAGLRAGIQFTKVPDELRAIIRACATEQGNADADEAAPAEEIPTVEIDAAAAPSVEVSAEHDLEVTRLRSAFVTREAHLEQRAQTATEAAIAPRRYTPVVANTVTAIAAVIAAVMLWLPFSGHRFPTLRWPAGLAQKISFEVSNWQQKVLAAPRITAAHPEVNAKQPASSAVLEKPSAPAPASTFVVSANTNATMPAAPLWPALSDRLLQVPQTVPAATASQAQPVKNSVPPSASVTDAKVATQPPGTSAKLVNTVQTVSSPDSRNGNSALGAQALWQQVAKGDAPAEIALAKLYLTGDGVPKSCVQARVLVDAARSSSRALAKQARREFVKYGCQQTK
jgi:hypothetical protein